MIKTIIFDVDGVIIESADIKTRAFELLFAGYPDKLPAMIDYHKKNAGISRYVKFRHFYQNILGQELPPEKEKELGDRFSQIVLKEVIKSPLVAGVEDFLKTNHQRYPLFIASGTPQEELGYILKQRRLDIYFQAAYGTPRTKPEIIKTILAKQRLLGKEAIFIGDAESDREAAEKVGVYFIARTHSENSQLQDCRWKVSDLTELDAILHNISLCKKEGG